MSLYTTCCGFAKLRKRMDRCKEFFRNVAKPQLYGGRPKGGCGTTVAACHTHLFENPIIKSKSPTGIATEGSVQHCLHSWHCMQNEGLVVSSSSFVVYNLAWSIALYIFQSPSTFFQILIYLAEF
jgi:hypothetical protein